MGVWYQMMRPLEKAYLKITGSGWIFQTKNRNLRVATISRNPHGKRASDRALLTSIPSLSWNLTI